MHSFNMFLNKNSLAEFILKSEEKQSAVNFEEVFKFTKGGVLIGALQCGGVATTHS